MREQASKQKFSLKSWFKRFGVVGFMFFLIKGLLWLIVPLVAAKFAFD